MTSTTLKIMLSKKKTHIHFLETRWAMEEIHSCGNQCKKLNTNEPLMQRMITYVQKFYFNETFLFFFDYSLQLLIFFSFFFFSPRDWNSHWKHTDKSSPSTWDLKKRKQNSNKCNWFCKKAHRNVSRDFPSSRMLILFPLWQYK